MSNALIALIIIAGLCLLIAVMAPLAIAVLVARARRATEEADQAWWDRQMPSLAKRRARAVDERRWN